MNAEKNDTAGPNEEANTDYRERGQYRGGYQGSLQKDSANADRKGQHPYKTFIHSVQPDPIEQSGEV